MQDQFDGVMGFVAGDPHLIDHIFDQEQAPAARRLQPGQLGIQVGGFRLRNDLAAAVVADANDQVAEAVFRPLRGLRFRLPRLNGAAELSTPGR